MSGEGLLAERRAVHPRPIEGQRQRALLIELRLARL